MQHSHRLTFISLVSLIFLLPLFFVPGGALDSLNAKALLIVVGTGIATVFFLFGLWKDRELVVPKHRLLSVALFLPLVYLLSALLSTPSSLSLLGYNFEVGTFGFVLLGVVILFLSSATFSDSPRALQAVLALFGSVSILALFVGIKVLFGPGVNNMGNPLGSWTDLGVAFALLSILSILALGMLPMKRSFKVGLSLIFLLLTLLMVVINFSTALILALVAAVLLFLYFSRIERAFHFHSNAKGDEGDKGSKGNRGGFFSGPLVLPIILGVVSLAFLVNPLLPGGSRLGSAISGLFGVSNSEVRPTLSTTLSISKAVLSDQALFGSGPNTFGKDWLIYKPVGINSTPFWGVEFPFGAGFIPTQISATGIIGSILWLAFFALLLVLAFRVLSHIPENRASRFALVSTLSVSLFLWAASFLYTPSATLLVMAFAFTGILLGLSLSIGIVPAYRTNFSALPARHVGILIIGLALVGTLYIGWQEVGKTLGAYHFKRAVDLSDVEGTSLSPLSEELEQAIKFAPLDSYFLTLSQLNFSQAQAIANSTTGTPEENRALFDQALGASITSAKAAVSANPARYGNWIALGQIYSALVAEPLKIEGAYESAQFAYNEAFKRNPSNPELPLLLAQLEINKRNIEEARSYLRSALALKEDYADAYVLLARLEASENNIPAAIASAEKLAIISPENAGIHFELGLLKYSNADYDGALTSLEKALLLSPDYANAKYYLALSLTKLGRKDEARPYLEELIISNPENVELKAALEELNSKK